MYRTECCDVKTVAEEEITQSNNTYSIQSSYVIEVLGLCSSCGEWTECYDDEEDIDWEDEVEYIKDHLEESK
tara:strand:- start:423 stop:638 length:216 start_codon:yes stop_codon:yes gene_type:complete